MLVIVEGPDGAGKSTLIQTWKLSRRYFVMISNAGPPPDMQSISRFVHMVRHRPHGMPLVCDRHSCISDRVYGPLLRNVDHLRDIPPNWGIADADAIVYCRPPLERILQNVTKNQHEQLAGVVEKITRLTNAYDLLFFRLEYEARLPVIHFDFTKDSTDALTSRIFDNKRMETVDEEETHFPHAHPRQAFEE